MTLLHPFCTAEASETRGPPPCFHTNMSGASLKDKFPLQGFIEHHKYSIHYFNRLWYRITQAFNRHCTGTEGGGGGGLLMCHTASEAKIRQTTQLLSEVANISKITSVHSSRLVFDFQISLSPSNSPVLSSSSHLFSSSDFRQIEILTDSAAAPESVCVCGAQNVTWSD